MKVRFFTCKLHIHIIVFSSETKDILEKLKKLSSLDLHLKTARK
jgi:hypothetical protein